MQRGSLKRFLHKQEGYVWRFRWREPGFAGPRTKQLGRCAEMGQAEARSMADPTCRGGH